MPIFYHRALLWNVWMPELLDKDNRLDSQWRGLQSEGWVAIPWFIQRQPAVDKEVAENHRHILERFHVCDVADRALRVGKEAPDIVAKDLDGKEFKLSDYRGKVVLLDFWGNW